MKNKILMAIFFSIISTNSWAINDEQHAVNFEKKDPAALSPNDIIENADIHLFEESLIDEVDSDTGSLLGQHYTGHENNRLSASFKASSNYEHFSEITSLSASYHRRMQSYQNLWWGALVKQTQGTYSAMASPPKSETGHVNSNTSLVKTSGIFNLTSAGLGLGYRFRLISPLTNNDKFFEHITSYLIYNMAQDKENDLNYGGPGLNSEYGLFYRTGIKSFLGFTLNYELNLLTRSAISNEKLSDRSLVLSYTSLGIEFGYYY